MNDKIVELQHQVKNNSDELQDFLRDLGNWTKQMEIKDEQLKQSKKKESAKFEPARSVEELKRKTSVETLKEVPKVSEEKKPKRINSYDYDAWSKFDAEQALAQVEDKNLPESELMDMDGEMRLQRAVVEKDRGNDFFKVV